MKIDEGLSGYLQELCRIDVSSSASRELLRQVGEIIAFMEELNGVDTSSVEEGGFDVPWLEGLLRRDEADDSGMGNELLELAPHREGGFVEVPAVFERTDGGWGGKPGETE